MQDSNELKSDVRSVLALLPPGSDTHRLAHIVLQLLDTLTYSPDNLSTFKAQREFVKLEAENKGLRIRVDTLQGELYAVKNEVNKFKKIFDFLMEQKAKQEGAEEDAVG